MSQYREEQGLDTHLVKDKDAPMTCATLETLRIFNRERLSTEILKMMSAECCIWKHSIYAPKLS